MKERFDRPGLVLHTRHTWTQHERAATPLLRRDRRGQARLLPDDASQQQLEVRRLFGHHDGRLTPFTIANELEGLARRRRAAGLGRTGTARRRRTRRGLRSDARSTAIVVLTATVAAQDT